MKVVENGMTTCRPVRSALTNKASRGDHPIEGQLPPTSPLALFFPLEEEVREKTWNTLFLFCKYHPSARIAGYEKCIYFSYVRLVDHCNTSTMNYN